MDHSKGSLILKALSPDADEAQLVAFLEKRAKSIPSEKIQTLLHHLPVILSRNVSEATGAQVVRRLAELGAEALFIPTQSAATSTAGENLLPGQPPKPDSPLAILEQRASIARREGKAYWWVLALLGLPLIPGLVWPDLILLVTLSTLSTVLAAFFFDRRHAYLATIANILLAGTIYAVHPQAGHPENWLTAGHWLPLAIWACMLPIIAGCTGLLAERVQALRQEMDLTNLGLLCILRYCIIPDEERENHSFRVAIYASRIAVKMGMAKDEIEELRLAALLHDLSAFKLSRTILCKALALLQEEQRTANQGVHLASTNDPMGRILPTILTYHNLGSASMPQEEAQPAPIGARILAVAEAFDTLTTQERLSPIDAKEQIVAGMGTMYDAEVVKAFTAAFNRLEMELPADIL